MASPSISVDSKDFVQANQDLKDLEELREQQIRACRDVITISKKIIYAVHRGEMDIAQKEIPTIKKALKSAGDKSQDTGMYTVAWQEYVEALAYYHVVADNKLPTRKDLGSSTAEYLMGLCDLCGELVRRGVNSAAKGNTKETQRMKELVERIFGEFLNFDLRNNELRKKADGIKYNLNKLEDVLYDLKIHQRS
ncbi:MAG TPA: hypothetical protein VJB12_00770 [Candidatus Nanoarchaeia archaeon]|nr:hypothetical protein [Candidatus Nanoarchaeia archaeon]HLD86575.1 hypothetical protein [Candidatus Nanoarchaeia archaeon]